MARKRHYVRHRRTRRTGKMLKSCSKARLKTALQRAHGKRARGKILGKWAANCTRQGKRRKK